ncbi:hypothetical protein, partial [Methylobacterium gnaphalii]|uniref:hypothetical protein n=1 Tax=Methylobacterium gnaphalii TaxID=1010610 RepID=UPI001EE2A99F
AMPEMTMAVTVAKPLGRSVSGSQRRRTENGNSSKQTRCAGHVIHPSIKNRTIAALHEVGRPNSRTGSNRPQTFLPKPKLMAKDRADDLLFPLRYGAIQSRARARWHSKCLGS